MCASKVAVTVSEPCPRELGHHSGPAIPPQRPSTPYGSIFRFPKIFTQATALLHTMYDARNQLGRACGGCAALGLLALPYGT